MNNSIPHIKVSVTVPVYNTSKYLRQCLDSLENQSLQEIEFILVNDGSTDNSGQICEEYARRNPKFKIIHQHNSGLAVARQIGLEHAKGEYIITCDSDDWIDTDMYKKLYQKAVDTNADIVMCGYIKEYPDGTNSIVYPKSINKRDNSNAHIFLSNIGSSWAKLIKRSFFINSTVKYEPDIHMGEDALINYKLFKFNPSIAYIPIAPYHYRRRYGESSYTTSIKTHYIKQYHYVYQWVKHNYTERRYLPYLLKTAVDTLTFCAMSEEPDVTFFTKFLSEELTWQKLFRLIRYKQARHVMLIKPFPAKTQIKIIKKYLSSKC